LPEAKQTQQVPATEGSTEATCFHLLDAYGRSWTIPAEVVPTKMKKHNFVVHKSLDLSDNAWVVSHYETGAAVCGGDTKEAAIANAIKKINGTTMKKFDDVVAKVRTTRREMEAKLRADRVAQILNA